VGAVEPAVVAGELVSADADDPLGDRLVATGWLAWNGTRGDEHHIAHRDATSGLLAI